MKSSSPFGKSLRRTAMVALFPLLAAAKAEPDVSELLRAQASRIAALEAEVAKLSARAPKPGKG